MPTPLGRPGRAALIAVLLSLCACDAVQQKIGVETQTAKDAAVADGKAVGGACRQSGRAIEDCYSIYSWLPRAAVFDGWREMDAYMRDNKLETIEPQLPPVPAPSTKKKPTTAPAAPPADEKPAEKAETKH